LGLGWADQPVLSIDREVELMGAPVLTLPERIELLIAHQSALAPASLGRIPGVARCPVAARLAPPASGVLRLPAALALLARELGLVDPLGPVDPAAHAGHREHLPLDLRVAEP